MGETGCITYTPEPNPPRVAYLIQTGTTAQVNQWCTDKEYPSNTFGGITVYITSTLAPLTPPTQYTIYKNQADGDSELVYAPNNSIYLPFVLFETQNMRYPNESGFSPSNRVYYKGSINPSNSQIQDWSSCT